VFLLPSHDEGMPMAILEAMQRGIPVVSTPVGAIPEVICDGVSGTLIPAGTPRQITEAILRLKSDPVLRQRVGSSGKAVFDERFEFSAGIEQIRGLYTITEG
jgi:glycosyltransferase involved in cell wall biosynthesis